MTDEEMKRIAEVVVAEWWRSFCAICSISILVAVIILALFK